MLKFMADEIAREFNRRAAAKWPTKGYKFAEQYDNESDQAWVLDMFTHAADKQLYSQYF